MKFALNNRIENLTIYDKKTGTVVLEAEVAEMNTEDNTLTVRIITPRFNVQPIKRHKKKRIQKKYNKKYGYKIVGIKRF